MASFNSKTRTDASVAIEALCSSWTYFQCRTQEALNVCSACNCSDMNIGGAPSICLNKSPVLSFCSSSKRGSQYTIWPGSSQVRDIQTHTGIRGLDIWYPPGVLQCLADTKTAARAAQSGCLESPLMWVKFSSFYFSLHLGNSTCLFVTYYSTLSLYHTKR